MTSPVRITGVGAVTALGETPEATFDALCEGRCALPSPSFGPMDPDALGLKPRDARTMRRASRALLAAARDAFGRAALDGAVPRERIAFFAGMGTVDYEVAELAPAVAPCLRDDAALDFDKFFSSEYQQIHPLWPLKMLNNVGQSQVAIDLDLRGDNATFSPHAEAGAQAVREADRCVGRGTATAAIAAAAGDEISPQALARHERLGWLSPTGTVRPFSARADGGVLGEAAAAIALESDASAVARGQSALARIAGWAMRCAARETVRAYSDAMAESMARALDEAHARPGDVAVIFANADGRPVCDAGEASAIREMFGAAAPVTSTKPALGATLAAAGVLDTVLATLALRRGVAPPCLNAAPDDTPGLDLVRESPRPIRGAAALVNTLGLTGQCASIVIRVEEQ